jgi:hypothetical protein
MKKIAIITMARNDEWFLNRWIAYYGSVFGQKNLYIYLDGLDQKKPSGAGDANVKAVEKLGLKVVNAERQRLSFLSDRASELLKKYDIVIGVDADEFLVIDPLVGKTLPEYLSSKKIHTSISPLGLDFAQNLKLEKTFNPNKKFLEQRRFALIHSRFTKASIITKPIRWGRGFHRIKGHNFHIDKNLYLLHFGNYNYDAVVAKMNHPDIIARNEVKHYIRNRLRIFNVVTNNKTHSEKIIPFARIMQTIFRSPFSWNKPRMLGFNWVIEIPERFRRIV